MSNIFKFHRRTMKSGGSSSIWADKAIGWGNSTIGYKAGEIQNGSNPKYALIVCPRNNGQATTADIQKYFNITNPTSPILSSLGSGTTTPMGGVSGQFYGSLWDGLANTDLLYSTSSSNYEAAAYCKSINMGGYTDWYLPAKDELELCYRSFKPDNTGNYATGNYVGGINLSIKYNAATNNFPGPRDANGNGAAYTTSSPARTSIIAFQTGSSEAFATGSGYTTSCESSKTTRWVQNFNSGGTVGVRDRAGNYGGKQAVRPVRRSLL